MKTIKSHDIVHSFLIKYIQNIPEIKSELENTYQIFSFITHMLV